MGTLESTSALHLGTVLNSKKYNNVKNVALSRLNRTLVYSIKAETADQSATLFDRGWGIPFFPFATVHISANDCDSGADAEWSYKSIVASR